MRRRRLIAGVSVAAAWSLLAQAQLQRKVARVGSLAIAPPTPRTQPVTDAFDAGLRENGLVVGQNIVIERRYSYGVAERFDDFAREFVRDDVDLILAPLTGSAVAARRATRTIPIVTTFIADPVGLGLVDSLARPGGNVTGTTSQGADHAAKWLQLLTDIVPGARLVAVLMDPGNPGHIAGFKQIAAAAVDRKVAILQVLRRTIDDLETAFASMSAQAVDGVIVFEDSLTGTHYQKFIALAAHHKLPAIYQAAQVAVVGGLASYGADEVQLMRRSGFYIARILGGAKPADLPMEQPTKFLLTINMKTARALGLAIPPSILVRADNVIE